jgi:hypothetical protein
MTNGSKSRNASIEIAATGTHHKQSTKADYGVKSEISK